MTSTESCDAMFEILGTRIRVRSYDHRSGQLLAGLLDPFRAVGGEARVDATFSLDIPSKVPSVVAAINHVVVDRLDCFAAHSGVVAAGGRAIAFPADSGAGKSTLVAACMLAGMSYLSDEALCIDYGDGLVSPYPKPLSLSAWTVRHLGLNLPEDEASERLLEPAQLGKVGSERLPLGEVLWMQRGTGPPRLEAIASSEAAALLLRHSFNHYRRPDEAFRLATGLARSARTWVLRWDEPRSAGELLANSFQ